ncbi:Dimethylaniline monooxygenase [Mycena indigotica]|uniref:Dimethylaniline monooxygenase n=1 Tax=Mycena indigotica TaxID=2126181 RepID=A0A8H6S002_9AGAR|nr:Dimethylaniline monooxygenase [Mycena indigotica]KAF7289957.1 Dimethylaniline monooxygenase [Mycena indigotica]
MVVLKLVLDAFLLAVATTAQQIPLNGEQPNEKWTQFHHPIRRVAVIGAGPAGLQAAAKLIEHNFEVRLFDRSPSPGGNWFYTDETPVREPYPDKPVNEVPDVPQQLPAVHYYKDGEDGISLEDRWKEHWQPRPLWDSLHTNSPAVITELPGVPYSAAQPWVLSNHVIQAHVRAYASLHNLNANDDTNVTSYATRAESLEKIKETQTWRLTLRKLERIPEIKSIKATWWTEEFDAIVSATGPYVAPHVPTIDGIDNWSRAIRDDDGYSIYHSQSYRRPQRYQNKTILIVGASVSASEIARDIAPFTKTLYTSIRVSSHIFHDKLLTNSQPHAKLSPFQLRSRLRFPEIATVVPEIKSFEPLVDHKKGIKDGKIHLVNGSVLTGIDEIILATGYIRSKTFGPNLTADGQPEDLHWTGHWIPDPTLAFTNVRSWTIGKYQSYAFAKVWEGTAHLPPQWEMQKDYDDRKYQFRGLFSSPQAEALFRQYVAWLNNESLENGGRFVEPWPLENREIFAYYSEVEWIKGYTGLRNFTDFENLPQSEWPSGHAAAWESIVFEEEGW